MLLALLVAMAAATAMAAFVCPGDGHFGDDIDCTIFYHCANGRAMEGSCPGGLFFNRVTEQCDWPEQVDCKLTLDNLRRLQVERPTKLYLTFDDGPKEGTTQVLDALKQHGVTATFFINSYNLVIRKPEERARNANNLVRMVAEGHVLADHSYDHMDHNSDGPTNAYTDIENDLSYFGERSINPVLDILHAAGFEPRVLEDVNATMTFLVRMPYSNNWRVRMADGKKVEHTCAECTVPVSSGRKGVQIADILADRLGAQVFGWDQEWNMNFLSNRMMYDGSKMFLRLGKGAHAKAPGKIVVLTHDVAYRPHDLTNGTADYEELLAFLDLAKSAGYEFSTLDKFHME